MIYSTCQKSLSREWENVSLHNSGIYWIKIMVKLKVWYTLTTWDFDKIWTHSFDLSNNFYLKVKFRSISLFSLFYNFIMLIFFFLVKWVSIPDSWTMQTVLSLAWFSAVQLRAHWCELVALQEWPTWFKPVFVFFLSLALSENLH